MTKGFKAAAFTLLGAAWVAVAGWPAVASAGSVPTGKPESVGLSTERLQRVHTAMQKQIDAGNIAGGGQAALGHAVFENAVRQAIVN